MFTRLVFVAVLLTGCGGIPPKVKSSSPRSVVVLAFRGVGEAQKLADVECRRHGRYARLFGSNVDGPDYVFDCVE